MRDFLALLLTILLFTLVALIIVALVVAWSFGVGWLMIRLLPFTLFEGTVLGLLASVTALHFGGNLATNLFGIMNSGDDDAWEDDEEELPIPDTRFAADEAEWSWEAWGKYVIANNIYMEMEDEPEVVHFMDDAQQRELAIRLTNIVVPILKRVQRGNHLPHIALSAAKREMKRQNLKPYEDDILRLACTITNSGIQQDELLQSVIGDKLWREPCDLPFSAE